MSGETHFIFIYLPEALEPDVREERYGDPLNTQLEQAGLGFVSGGGSLLSAPDENGSRDIIHIGVDVDVYDLDAGRALLRRLLPELGCPAGTKLEFSDHEAHWADLFDSDLWHLRQPRQLSE